MSRVLFPLLLLLLLPSSVHAWWQLSEISLSSDGTIDPLTCTRLPGLSRRQREMCKRHGRLMGIVAEGVQIALTECEHTFEGGLWNCSARAREVTGTPSKIASKESAYVYALTAASVTQAIAKACAKGDLPECGCGSLPSATSSDSFMWSGCSDNVKFGNTFGRKFMDAEERTKADARSLMNLHNNRVGRQMLASGMEKACKCHGVSGSCATKTCWKVVPKMNDFAANLKRKFDDALQEDVSRVASQDLVYLDEPPDMCANPLEVSARECGAKCLEICCGRGWKTVRRAVDENCDCEVVWSNGNLEVKCETCSVKKETNYCK